MVRGEGRRFIGRRHSPCSVYTLLYSLSPREAGPTMLCAVDNCSLHDRTERTTSLRLHREALHTEGQPEIRRRPSFFSRKQIILRFAAQAAVVVGLGVSTGSVPYTGSTLVVPCASTNQRPRRGSVSEHYRN